VQFSQKIAQAGKDISEGLSTENQLTFLVLQSLRKDNSFFKLGVDSIQDASSHFMEDFIKNRLIENGIEKEFEFSLYTRDSAYYLDSPRKVNGEVSTVRYPVEVKGYLPLSLNKNLILELQFRDLNSYFLSQLNGMLVPSLLFILIILVLIVWIMRSYLSQRNLIMSTNEFINNFTHELKTPVFAIGLASKLLEKEVSEDKKPVFEVIRTQTARLNLHIDKILELSKLESKKQLFKFSKFDFRPDLEALLEDFKALANLENLKFDYELEPGPYQINGVKSHLENAILNVLDNSKKYASDPDIKLWARKDKKMLRIQISDNGEGIHEKDLQYIFKKFARVSKEKLQAVPGHGIGLAYVKEVVKSHGGKIEINSKLNEGTDVIIVIPLIHA
jgi:two-component system phosphate regulon sensor histidine kinase PhoR